MDASVPQCSEPFCFIEYIEWNSKVNGGVVGGGS